jgi:putative CocE/NonD family hydrolase
VTHLESAGGRIVVERDVRIRMRDGVHLSADVYRPDRPGRFGAILEHIPYRKDDLRALQDRGQNLVLVEAGFVCVRLDVRGTGSSEGVALDEYTEAETLDGFDAVEWLAAQPWCDGAVGMWGISYGAFTSIQVAKLRPPHLRAIVPIMGTDDRYLSDVHYIGGCVTASELSQYAVSQLGMNAMPPDPAFRGHAWRDEWLARLDATPPWLIDWLRQQHDGPYWRAGSLAPDHEAIEAAILNVGGWMDSYVDAALRMQAACAAPSRSRDRTSTTSTSWSVSSTAGSRGSRTAPTASRRSSGSNASTPSLSRSPRHGPGAGGRRRPTRIRPSRRAPGRSPVAPCLSSARC